MDAWYCSVCIKKVLPSLFLEDAVALPQSKIFATCYICREKGRLRRRKRKALAETDLNIPPPLRRPTLHSLQVPFRSSETIQPPLPPVCSPPPPVRPPLPPVRPTPPTILSTGQPNPPSAPPIAGFLPTDQWQTLHDFHTHLGTIKMDTCTRCNARWFDMRLKDGVCHTCFLKDKGGQTPLLFSADNEMDLGAVPAYLPVLTQIEEMVIAWSHVQMMIKRYRGHQYHYTGHCVSFAQEIIKTVSILPNLPEELDIILLRPSGQRLDQHRYRQQFEHDFWVRRSCILAWLRFLQAHHPDYKYITICSDRLQSLPLDGDISDSLTSIDTDEAEDPQPEVLGQELDMPPPNTQSTIPNSSSDDTEINLILQELTGHIRRNLDVPAPSIRTTPIDEAAGTQRIYAMAFPTLYPYGQADLNASREQAVTLKEYAYHLLRYADGRFGRHPRWRFLVFNILMRQKSKKSAWYYVSKSSNMTNLTWEELGEALNLDPSLLPQIVRQGSNLTRTRPFWKNKGQALEAQARFLTPQMSPIFITFSCADLQ